MTAAIVVFKISISASGVLYKQAFTYYHKNEAGCEVR
jgi:hypothetical protein